MKKFVNVKFDTNIVKKKIYNSNDFVKFDETINFYFVVQLLKNVESKQFCEFIRKNLIAFFKF